MVDDFLIRAFIAGCGLVLAAGPLGCFVVWRKMAYFGDSVAHAALLGVALSLAFSVSPFIGVLIVALVVVTNIDIASKMIDYISARQTKVRNIKCNILDYSAEQYDGVWASRSLIHIPPKDFEKALKQISGCLKPSGMLAMILLLTNSETLVEQTGPNLLANRPEVTSYRVLHSEQSATAALKTTGYSIANKVTVTDRDNEACIYFEALAHNDL